MTSAARQLSNVTHVTVGCHDPYALAGFWAEVVGGRRSGDDHAGDPEVSVTHAGTALLFQQVPDPRAAKRVHLDLRPESSRAQEVERLLALGATLVADRTEPDGAGWVVLADPEGNEFCVVRSAAERGEPAPVDSGERPMPPLHAAAEREMLEGMLEWYREGVARKVEGMRQVDATTTLLRSGTTAAGLVKHLAAVEDSWFTHGVAGEPEAEPWASAPFDDDPDWEFTSATNEPLTDSVALYEVACARSRAVAAGRGLDDEATNRRGRVFTLRFVYLHLIEETARHLGHLDILRELADGSTGE